MFFGEGRREGALTASLLFGRFTLRERPVAAALINRLTNSDGLQQSKTPNRTLKQVFKSAA